MTESTVTNILLRFKLVGFNNIDKANFESVFDLAEGRLNVCWRLVVSDAESDFYLLKGQLRNQMQEDKVLKRIPLDRCVFCLQEATGEGNELILGSDNIPSMRSLIELFNQLSTTLNRTQDNINSLEDKKELGKEKESIANTEYYDPEQGFLKFLLSTGEQIYCFEVNTQEESESLYVDIANKVYFSKNSLEQLQPFFCS